MEKDYPEPQASHNDVFNDAKRFWETFQSFQSHMEMNDPNTINSFITNVPATADGKAADMQLFLHVLYKQVTGYGGYENVDSRKKWNEVSSVFNFVPTAKDDPAVFLRHLYKSLLYQYEQTYFFRREGPLRSPPTPGMHADGNGTTQQGAPKRTRSLVSDSGTYTYPADQSLMREAAEEQIEQAVLGKVSQQMTPNIESRRPLEVSYPSGTMFSGIIMWTKEDNGFKVKIVKDEEEYAGVLYLYTKVNRDSVAGSSAANMPQDPNNTENEQKTLQLF